MPIPYPALAPGSAKLPERVIDEDRDLFPDHSFPKGFLLVSVMKLAMTIRAGSNSIVRPIGASRRKGPDMMNLEEWTAIGSQEGYPRVAYLTRSLRPQENSGDHFRLAEEAACVQRSLWNVLQIAQLGWKKSAFPPASKELLHSEPQNIRIVSWSVRSLL